jgi:hypothetical protein
MKVTPEHRILVNGIWKTAGEIKIGDKLLGSLDQEIEVLGIETVKKTTTVYNFETKDNHTYIAYGAVVHNRCDLHVLFDKYSVEDNGKVYDKNGRELSSKEVFQLAHNPLLKDSDQEALIGSLSGNKLFNLLIDYHNESLGLSGDKLGENADLRRELLGYLAIDNKYNDLSGQQILIVNQIEKQNNSDLHTLAVGHGKEVLIGIIGVGVGYGIGKVIGASENLVQNQLFKSAVEPFNNSTLSNAGRALTKHPELVGLTKDTLRQTYRLDSQLNEVASEQLKNIMRNGTQTIEYAGRSQTSVIQYRLPNGYGARFNMNGSFQTFIQP